MPSSAPGSSNSTNISSLAELAEIRRARTQRLRASTSEQTDPIDNTSFQSSADEEDNHSTSEGEDYESDGGRRLGSFEPHQSNDL